MEWKEWKETSVTNQLFTMSAWEIWRKHVMELQGAITDPSYLELTTSSHLELSYTTILCS